LTLTIYIEIMSPFLDCNALKLPRFLVNVNN